MSAPGTPAREKLGNALTAALVKAMVTGAAATVLVFAVAAAL